MRFNIQQQTEIGSISLKDLALKTEYLKPALIVLSLMVLMQIGGINAVLFYLTGPVLSLESLRNLRVFCKFVSLHTRLQKTPKKW